jgi:hypothetical protein
MGFLNVSTDGKRKDRHNKEVLLVLKLLQKAGCCHYLLHHVKDAGMTKSLPLQIGNKWYDLSYVSEDGEIFLVEIMRIGEIFVQNDDPRASS